MANTSLQIAFPDSGGDNTTWFDYRRRLKDAAAAPTSLTWAVGDFVRNTSPAISGDGYLTLGWACTTAGTPGTWTAVRVLTTSAPVGLLYNFIYNDTFAVWGAGTSTVPTGWTAVGAGASYAKNTTSGQFRVGSAGLQVTRSGTNCYAAQNIAAATDSQGDSLYSPIGRWKSKTITVGAWVYATLASRARLVLSDGVSSSQSSYHTGDSTLQWLTVTRTMDASATIAEIRLAIDAGDTSATFSGVTLIEGSSLPDHIPGGWKGRKCILTFFSAGTVTAGSTVYLGPAYNNATEANARYRAPYRGVARNLRVQLGGNVGGSSQTATTNLRKNGSDSSPNVTVTINSGAANGSDTTNECAYAADDQINGKVVLTASTGNLAVNAACEYEEVPGGI